MIMTTIAAKVGIYLSSLTPLERWEAFTQMGSDIYSRRILIASAIALVMALTSWLITAIYNSILKNRRAANKLFNNYAEHAGLSRRECRILLNIAKSQKLKQVEAIFTSANIFDRGATKITRAALANEGSEASKLLSAELSILRQKLGYRKVASFAMNMSVDTKPNSRQIPEGSTLNITSLKAAGFVDSVSILRKSDDSGLTIETADDLEVGIGEQLTVRYYFGSSIWEFDGNLLDRSGKSLLISHSESVRFVNRRRFLRVPVKEPAYIAAFPFAKQFADADLNGGVDNIERGLPRFMPADIVELAGPGLRIVTAQEYKVGDRVIVVAGLGSRTGKGAEIAGLAGQENLTPAQKENIARPEMVEDIGLVRQCKAIDEGYSVAVEMTGLSDADLNQMIRATNAASIRGKLRIQDIPGVDNQEKDRIMEPELVTNQEL
jgi:hypothetical protein